MRRLSLVLVLALAACGANGANDQVRSQWTVPPTAAEPPSFGKTIARGAHALLAAARKQSYDAKWSCGDDAADLKSTPDASSQLAALGDAPELLTSTVTLSFTSPAKGYEPQDVQDDPQSDSARVFWRGRMLVTPDGNTSWIEAKAYLAALEQPNVDRAAVDSLVEPLRIGLADSITSATSAKCDVHLTTEEDLARLPVSMDKIAQRTVLAEVATQRAALPRTCKALSKGTGPWEVHFSHVDAVFKGSGTALARLRAKLRLHSGAPCLGPVEIIGVTGGAQ